MSVAQEQIEGMVKDLVSAPLNREGSGGVGTSRSLVIRVLMGGCGDRVALLCV